MNWMGGKRSRARATNDESLKQRRFFERQRRIRTHVLYSGLSSPRSCEASNTNDVLTAPPFWSTTSAASSQGLATESARLPLSSSQGMNSPSAYLSNDETANRKRMPKVGTKEYEALRLACLDNLHTNLNWLGKEFVLLPQQPRPRTITSQHVHMTSGSNTSSSAKNNKQQKSSHHGYRQRYQDNQLYQHSKCDDRDKVQSLPSSPLYRSEAVTTNSSSIREERYGEHHHFIKQGQEVDPGMDGYPPREKERTTTSIKYSVNQSDDELVRDVLQQLQDNTDGTADPHVDVDHHSPLYSVIAGRHDVKEDENMDAKKVEGVTSDGGMSRSPQEISQEATKVDRCEYSYSEPNGDDDVDDDDPLIMPQRHLDNCARARKVLEFSRPPLMRNEVPVQNQPSTIEVASKEVQSSQGRCPQAVETSPSPISSSLVPSRSESENKTETKIDLDSAPGFARSDSGILSVSIAQAPSLSKVHDNFTLSDLPMSKNSTSEVKETNQLTADNVGATVDLPVIPSSSEVGLHSLDHEREMLPVNETAITGVSCQLARHSSTAVAESNLLTKSLDIADWRKTSGSPKDHHPFSQECQSEGSGSLTFPWTSSDECKSDLGQRTFSSRCQATVVSGTKSCFEYQKNPASQDTLLLQTRRSSDTFSTIAGLRELTEADILAEEDYGPLDENATKNSCTEVEVATRHEQAQVQAQERLQDQSQQWAVHNSNNRVAFVYPDQEEWRQYPHAQKQQYHHQPVSPFDIVYSSHHDDTTTGDPLECLEMGDLTSSPVMRMTTPSPRPHFRRAGSTVEEEVNISWRDTTLTFIDDIDAIELLELPFSLQARSPSYPMPEISPLASGNHEITRRAPAHSRVAEQRLPNFTFGLGQERLYQTIGSGVFEGVKFSSLSPSKAGQRRRDEDVMDDNDDQGSIQSEDWLEIKTLSASPEL